MHNNSPSAFSFPKCRVGANLGCTACILPPTSTYCKPRTRGGGCSDVTAALERNGAWRFERKASPGDYFPSWLHKVPRLCSENARQTTRKLKQLQTPSFKSCLRPPHVARCGICVEMYISWARKVQTGARAHDINSSQARFAACVHLLVPRQAPGWAVPCLSPDTTGAGKGKSC